MFFRLHYSSWGHCIVSLLEGQNVFHITLHDLPNRSINKRTACKVFVAADLLFYDKGLKSCGSQARMLVGAGFEKEREGGSWFVVHWTPPGLAESRPFLQAAWEPHAHHHTHSSVWIYFIWWTLVDKVSKLPQLTSLQLLCLFSITPMSHLVDYLYSLPVCFSFPFFNPLTPPHLFWWAAHILTHTHAHRLTADLITADVVP